MQPHVVIFDGSNMFHRAKSGFLLGEFNVVFNFFRSFRSLTELLKPSRVIVACDGEPVARKLLFPGYKGNRVVKEKDREAHEKFVKQRDIILSLLCTYFPVSVMRHPENEADDLIYTVVKNGAKCTPFTIVSSDTDFTQMLNEFENVKIYNPITKRYVEKTAYCYLTWKSLRGDGSDNIPGLPGVSDDRAVELVCDTDLFKRCFETGELDIDTFNRNLELITLKHLQEDEWSACTSSEPHRDWDAVRAKFVEFDFKSVVKEPYFTHFVETFDTLWQTSG